MSRLAQDGKVEPLSKPNFQARTGKEKRVFFPVQLTTSGIFFPVDPYSAESADHTYPSSSSTYARMPYHGITPS